MEKLKQEPFVKSVSHFTPASFKIGAYTDKDDNIPLFYTDLFFESIPDKYSIFNPMTGNGLKAVGLCLLSSPRAI